MGLLRNYPEPCGIIWNPISWFEHVIAILIGAIFSIVGIIVGYYQSAHLRTWLDNRIGKKLSTESKGSAKLNDPISAQLNRSVQLSISVTTKDTPPDTDQIRREAKLDNPEAMNNLGAMYAEGLGIDRDGQEAVIWYKKSAKKDNLDAMFRLGIMYEEGQVVPQNYIQAHKWLNLAASKSVEQAAKDRDQVAGKMTPQQLEEAQKLASEWHENHPS